MKQKTEINCFDCLSNYEIYRQVKDMVAIIQWGMKNYELCYMYAGVYNNK